MANKTWTTGDALTGATLNKDISAAVSAGGTFTPYTPMVGSYCRNSSVYTTGGAKAAPVSLGASQSTGGYALQGDLVHFWAMYQWDATQSFNGTPPTSGIARAFCMSAPFPMRPLDWADYGTLTGTDLGKARWVPTSINLSMRPAPQYGFQRCSIISPLYDGSVAGYVDNLADDWTDAQLASMVNFRGGVGGASYTQVNNRDIGFDSHTDPTAANTPTGSSYNFTDEEYTVWFFMSGWYIRTDDRLVEHPAYVG